MHKKGDEKNVVGYTSGVYDLFHIGHLNLIKNAKGLCDKLIVGVTSDELVAYKNKKAVIPHQERMEIVRNIRHVDSVVPQNDMDKFKMWQRLKFDVMFVGDDWFETEKWQELDERFKAVGVKIIYFPYTEGTSSSLINKTLEDLRNR
jgi:glycerol-3-phosphate cytidylyltransferase